MFSFFQATPSVTPKQAYELLSAGHAVCVDVRSRAEYAEGHVDTAMNIPLEELATHPDAFNGNRQILTMCRSGRRSATAAAYLRRHGYTAFNIAGGIEEWKAQGLPVAVGA